MRTIVSIILLLTFSTCYTKLYNVSNSSNLNDIEEIVDSTTFLPKESFTTDEYSIHHLINNWVNSREEENSIIKIYRPENYKKFPISRFRDKINFYKNGKCEYLVLESTDRQHFEKYRWRLLKEDSNIIYLYNNKARVSKRIRIENLE